MRRILTQLPIRTAAELSSFEETMVHLTTGFSLKRCMAYSNFRMKVLQYQQTRAPFEGTFFLVHNHSISVEDGVATLYKQIEEDDAEECFDKRENESPSDDRSSKRTKFGNPL